MNKSSQSYHPEPYWSDVASRIRERGQGNVVAGDDSPYYRYKRKKFLHLLHSISFEGKKVLEIGHGPGGNLVEVLKRKPALLAGADISENMIQLAKSNLLSAPVQFTKTNGEVLDFPNQFFDIVFSATVLQHNTEDEMMNKMLREMFRTSKNKVVLFERIEKFRKGDHLCVGRTIEDYRKIAEKEGFRLVHEEYINIQVSYLICGAIRKLFSSGNHKEGEPLNKITFYLQKWALPVTALLDKLFKVKRDLAKLVFVRQL